MKKFGLPFLFTLAFIVGLAPTANAASVTSKTWFLNKSEENTIQQAFYVTSSPLSLSSLPGFKDYQLGDVGLFSWILGSKNWAEFHSGLTYQPFPWLQLGLGLGLEQAENPFRVGSFFWLGGDWWWIQTDIETGGSGLWYQSIGVFVKKNHDIEFGYFARSGEGIGPYLSHGLSRFGIPLKFWQAPLLYDPQTKQFGLLGISSGLEYSF